MSICRYSVVAGGTIVLWLLAINGFGGPSPGGATTQPAAATAVEKPRLMLQTGAPNSVCAIGVSADGRLAAVSDGNCISVWDVPDRAELRAIWPRRQCNAMALTPDGRWIAVVLPPAPSIIDDPSQEAGQVCVWDSATGALRQQWALDDAKLFTQHEASSIAFSPDGATIAVGGAYGEVVIRPAWPAAGKSPAAGQGGQRGKLLCKLKASVNRLCFDRSGQRLAACDSKGLATVIDIATGKELFLQSTQATFTSAMALSPAGDLIATGTSKGHLAVWDVAGGRQLAEHQFARDQVCAVRFSQDGSKLLVGRGLDVAIVNARSLAAIDSLRTLDAVIDIALADDGRLLFAPLDTAEEAPWNARIWTGTGYSGVAEWDLQAPAKPAVMTGKTADVHQAFFSQDGKQVVVLCHDLFAHWDLAAGKLTGVSPTGMYGALQVVVSRDYSKFVPLFMGGAAFVNNGQAVVFADEITDGEIDIRDLTGAKTLKDIVEGKVLCNSLVGHAPLASIADGSQLLLCKGTTLEAWDVNNPKKPVRLAVFDDLPTPQQRSPEGKKIAAQAAQYGVGSPLAGFPRLKSAIRAGNGGLFAIGYADGDVVLRNLKRRDWSMVLANPDSSVTSLAFNNKGDRIAVGYFDGAIILFSVPDGTKQATLTGHTARVASVAFDPADSRLLSASPDGTTRLWDLSNKTEIATLTEMGTHWAVVAPDGRFETDDLVEAQGLHWVFADDPLHALPLAIYLRDYLEPGLLTELLAGAKLPTLRPLQQLNRAQPNVSAIVVTRHGQTADVSVTVDGGEYQIAQTGRTDRTDAYDLRLFRDGRLVGQYPPPSADTLDRAMDSDVSLWRKGTHIGQKTISFPHILLPQSGPSSVEFSAYAFNADRVKGPTARVSLTVANKDDAPSPRAYVICMGVDKSQSSDFDLRFAGADARLVHDGLGPRLVGYDVAPVLLVSDGKGDFATKENLQAVLEILAGKMPDAAALARLPGECKGLQRATPDDLVLLSFSGHGCTAGGEFYLLPSDIGPGQRRDRQPPAQMLQKCISTEELSRWLRQVDAGQTALVIDACQSAATIQQEGFKPGPLGNRGLGQLAYDKQMRVLAASQSDREAIESRSVQHGLLTYALVHDGLAAGQAPHGQTPVCTLGDCMNYAAGRVPGLYWEVRNDKINDFGIGDGPRGMTFDLPAVPATQPAADDAAQHPAVFDFADPSQDAQLRLGK